MIEIKYDEQHQNNEEKSMDYKSSKHENNRYFKRSTMRKNFGTTDQLEIPCMIKLQLESYAEFLQKDTMPENRKHSGLQAILADSFPLVNSTNTIKISFLNYHIDSSYYSPKECKERGVTYAGPLKLSFDLIVKNGEEYTQQEKEIYICEIPLMTDAGTFIINGTERVVISQLHRSPGIFFEKIDDEFGSTYLTRIIPAKGLWLDFEIDEKGHGFALINKKRLPMGQLLVALLDEDKHEESLNSQIFELLSPMAKVEVKKIDNQLHPISKKVSNLSRIFEELEVHEDKKQYVDAYNNCVLFSDVIISNTLIAVAGSNLTEKILNEIPDGHIIHLVDPKVQFADYTIKVVQNMKLYDRGLINTKIANLIRPNEQLKSKATNEIFQKHFFEESRYSLSEIGRAKLNYRLGTNKAEFTLCKEDIVLVVRSLFAVCNGEAPTDHPDSLMHRRVRSVGELVGNQIQQAVTKMVRFMQDKMIFSTNTITLSDLINSRHFISVIREFFGTSPLCQVQDQTGDLARISHTRRLTAFGPGGLKRDRAFAEVRVLHPTHYGRICFNETPDGYAIGLVNSKTLYSTIDAHGFICTPYKEVISGKITENIVYLSCLQEMNKVIAHYNLEMIKQGHVQGELIDCRKNNEHYLASASEVTHIDVSPKQLFALSGSLLPFINHCDAARIVMGANMQRQALSLIRPTSALIGTGMETVVVRDSASSLRASCDGTVAYVSGSTIILKNDNISDSINTVYKLCTFERSNDSSITNQTPTVSIGDRVKKGDIIAIGEGVQGDEMALGRNLKVAFISWKGYNFEDAIIVSSKVAKQFRSLSLSKFEISIRDVRHGMEQWTRDLPNITSNFTENLDECGIINLGTHVKEGDILVGKITPKAEMSSTPAERLIRAVFGTKGFDVDETSLRVPPRVQGTVVGIKVLSKEGAPKNKRIIEIERQIINDYIKDRNHQLTILNDSFRQILGDILLDSDQHMANNLQIEALLNLSSYLNNADYLNVVSKYKEQKEFIVNECELQCQKELEGASLPSGVLQTIQVFVATEYVLQVGDKMAGRHGNKGIVSIVLNESEMPFTKDGEPVDIICTSTGISGRMNLGQILEAHLGWASVHLGKKIYNLAEQVKSDAICIDELRNFLLKIYDKPNEKERIQNQSDIELLDFASKLKNGVPFACPVFEGPSKDRIKELLELAGCHPSGKEELFHPDTGEKLPQRVTVGIVYFQQLHHYIAKKEHARAVGPYSVVSQQPLGGRAQKGGQRFGEMECWALQAHSAAYTAREMLTVKSDCPVARSRVFQLITQGYDVFNAKGIPESFAVLINELKALCLNVECLKFNNGEFIAHEISTLTEFDALRISVASPEQILSWSYGEVKKPETIHYRTFRPHPDGIFSTKIFGPIKDNQCLCGKYKGSRKRGIICSKCHTEVTSSNVRRYRCGHIKLAAPVAHVWFAKILPSRIAIVLDMSNTNLNKILRLEYYVVINPGLSPKTKGMIISEHEYFATSYEYKDTGFSALTGAEAIDVLLKNVNLTEEIEFIKKQLISVGNLTIRDKLLKRLQILNSFVKNGSKLDAMVLKVLNVMPPENRPLVSIDGGRFASSDLNDLYRRVINRNNRLFKMLDYATPYIIIKNEKRMLQEAVDALLDNSKRAQPVTTANKRPLKSIADSIKGKQGRFRQNLLGKRVDYSGRSVIVVGPYLKLHQCGLPKSIALELFRPFVLARLILRGFVSNPKAAKIMIEKRRDEVWDILHEIMSEHVVLLNRAPTLHRLGVQAFEPILVEGKAIHLHPVTCKAYNADFDGDQIGVHALLSTESQLEACQFMMSTKCIISPANASIIASPMKDIVLGLYAMTSLERGFKGDDMRFSSTIEAEHALALGVIRYSTPIKVLCKDKLIETTYGRLQLYETISKETNIDFKNINKALTSKDVQNILYEVYSVAGEKATVALLDSFMRYGFQYATECGATFSFSDLPVPKEKKETVQTTKQSIIEYHRQYKEGLILREDLYNKTVAAWTQCTEKLSKSLISEISKVKNGEMMNPITAMMLSGARGSELQIRQLSAIKGLIAKANGSLHESAVTSSFLDGVEPEEYMIISQGARKSLADIAFKTADSGYLTRRLAAVAQDIITKTQDCGTNKYIEISIEGPHLASLDERAFGRTAAEEIRNDNNEVITKNGEIITKEMTKQIKESSITRIKVRSPIVCEAGGSHICCKCYGYDLSTLKQIEENIAIGIIAAQSIGEPGTQLTMKNFQVGGAAQNVTNDSKVRAITDSTVHLNSTRTAFFEGKSVVITKNNLLTLINNRGEVVSEHRIPQGAIINVKNGDFVEKDSVIADWDNYISPIICTHNGTILFRDIIPGTSCREATDKITGTTTFIITKDVSWLNPTLVMHADDQEIEYPLEIEDTILVSHGEQVMAGQVLAERIKNVVKSQDIIDGLDKIITIFEVGKPKNPAIVTSIEGYVDIRKVGQSRKIVITDQNEIEKEYQVPKNTNIIVSRGDFVKAGDALTEGKLCAQDILQVGGLKVFTRWMISETQNVYKMQGIRIAEIHLEVIIRQMLRSASIINPGDTNYNKGEIVDISEIERVNKLLIANNNNLVEYELNLSGITKAAIADRESFISAASFQETPKILIDAALRHEIDPMDGIKASMMAGQLMPVGAGGFVRDIVNNERRNDMLKLIGQAKIEHILKDKSILADG